MSESLQITENLRQWMSALVTRSLHDWSRYVRTTGLSMPQFGILMYLYHHGRCGMSSINARLDVTNAAASQLVDRLVQGGLVERSEDPQDRRARRIALTDRGRQLIEGSISERFRWVENLVQGLSDEEQAIVLKALSILLDATQKMNGTPMQPE